MNGFIRLSTRVSMGLLALLLLAGCASTRGYYYDDGYYTSRDGYHSSRYARSYGSDYYAGGSGYGDYYYSDYDYRYPGYFDSPLYYSMFWPINRWYVDPYRYPGYYYGVTYFPRNYFSLGFGWSSGLGRWPLYSHFAYSPYRHGWSDWYYDWYPWYRHYPSHRHHHGTPRYGDARNEAERLARLSGAARRADAYALSTSALSPSNARDRFAAGGRSMRGDAALRAGDARTPLPLRGRGSERALRDDGFGDDARGGRSRGRGVGLTPRVRDAEPDWQPRARTERAAPRRPARAMLPQRDAQATPGRGIASTEGYPVRRAPQQRGIDRPQREAGPRSVERYDRERAYAAPRRAELPQRDAYRQRNEPAQAPSPRGYARTEPAYVPRASAPMPAPRLAPPPAPAPAPTRSYERDEPTSSSVRSSSSRRDHGRSSRSRRDEP